MHWRMHCLRPIPIIANRGSFQDGPTIHRDTSGLASCNRQIFIGMGCFLETLKIAVTETGHSVEFDILPQGEQNRVDIKGATDLHFNKPPQR